MDDEARVLLLEVRASQAQTAASVAELRASVAELRLYVTERFDTLAGAIADLASQYHGHTHED